MKERCEIAENLINETICTKPHEVTEKQFNHLKKWHEFKKKEP